MAAPARSSALLLPSPLPTSPAEREGISTADLAQDNIGQLKKKKQRRIVPETPAVRCTKEFAFPPPEAFARAMSAQPNRLSVHAGKKLGKGNEVDLGRKG